MVYCRTGSGQKNKKKYQSSQRWVRLILDLSCRNGSGWRNKNVSSIAKKGQADMICLVEMGQAGGI